MTEIENYTRDEVIAKIYNLSASILLGKTTEEEIEEVYRLAQKHNCLKLFAAEIRDCDKIIANL